MTRTTGTDIDGRIYQVARTGHSDPKSYGERYDDIKWEEEDEG